MIHYLPKKSHYGKSIVAHLPRVDKVEPFPCMEIRGHMSFPVRAQDADHDQRRRYIEKDRWWDTVIAQYRNTDNYLAAARAEDDQTGLRVRLASRATLTFAALSAKSEDDFDCEGVPIETDAKQISSWWSDLQEDLLALADHCTTDEVLLDLCRRI